MTAAQGIPVSRALLSVSDKTGLLDFARALHARGIALLSTGGTFKALTEAGIPATEVADFTGFPEMMDGRVKTLHPRIHGGILGRRDQDQAVMAAHGILPIDLVCVNLYPFAATIARPETSHAEAIEQIDIGGPAMVRSAAKNHVWVGIVTAPSQYAEVIAALDTGAFDLNFRATLAKAAFQHTAAYDATIANYLGQSAEAPAYPEQLFFHAERVEILRYGENPHQTAAFYRDLDAPAGTLGRATQLAGKALSFNNIADTDAALECVRQFAQPACVIVKHANPCGVAIAATLAEAYEAAYATDPTSAFGGIIAFNHPLDAQTAETILRRQFVEVVIAPAVADGVMTLFAGKPNVRLLTVGALQAPHPQRDIHRIQGGLLVQDTDLGQIEDADLTVVTERAPTASERADLLFAWRVAKFVKSNAIVYAKEGQTIGVGAGQMSRIYSARIAAIKAADAGLTVAGSVMASDAFFPFRDGIDAAADAGIQAVIQPGGSMRDAEVIEAANQHGMAMVFTGMRHFRH